MGDAVQSWNAGLVIKTLKKKKNKRKETLCSNSPGPARLFQQSQSSFSAATCFETLFCFVLFRSVLFCLSLLCFAFCLCIPLVQRDIFPMLMGYLYFMGELPLLHPCPPFSSCLLVHCQAAICFCYCFTTISTLCG